MRLLQANGRRWKQILQQLRSIRWRRNSHSPPSSARASLVFTKFCASCGRGLVAAAVICPNCGAAQKGFSTAGGKSKTTAILLAVFLSAWTWVYTSKANSKKFLIALVLWVVEVIIFIIGAQHFSSTFACGQMTSQCSVHPGSASFILVSYLIAFAIWIWAIIDASTESQEFYSNL
jgi:hypothetical protein